MIASMVKTPKTPVEIRQEPFKEARLSARAMVERADLDWKRLRIMKEGGTLLEFRYPLTPKFFLKSAKEDLREGSDRGLINALSNAKRAIDCQTDTFLSAIGYTAKGLDKQLEQAVRNSLKCFVSDVEQPLKFRVLESLGIVTPAIVARVRRIRNMLEHHYRKPAKAAVRDAIDVAALYVSACEGSMNTFLEAVHLQAGEVYNSTIREMTSERQFSIQLDWAKSGIIELGYFHATKRERSELKIGPSDRCDLAWLRVIFAVRAEDEIEGALIVALELSGYDLAGKTVRVRELKLG
jgi:hypothetical protein